MGNKCKIGRSFLRKRRHPRNDGQFGSKKRKNDNAVNCPASTTNSQEMATCDLQFTDLLPVRQDLSLCNSEIILEQECKVDETPLASSEISDGAIISEQTCKLDEIPRASSAICVEEPEKLIILPSIEEQPSDGIVSGRRILDMSYFFNKLKQEVPTIAEPDAGTSTRSETTSHDVFRPHTDVVTMPQVVSSRTSNSRFLVVGHDQNTQASTSATTSQEKDARVKKRKGSLPEAKTIIKSVFNYLQTEYENFKTFTGGSCDLSPLENILGRTAAAIGVSEDEITAVLDERGSDDSSDESSSKRARVSRDNYDGSISPIEEDSSEEKADEAQPDNRESTFEAEENLIETLKVEIDENVEYHSKPNTGILFQTPFTREQMSVLHQSLSLTEPTHAEVKQEPADVEEQQKMSVCHHTSLTEPTHAEVKQELVDVKEQQRLKQMELSDDVEYTGGEQDPLGDTEYPSSPTMQVGRLPD